MYGFVIPANGMNLLAKLLAGDSLVITKIMVGSGQLPDGADPRELSDLIQPVAEATSTVPQADGNTCSFVIEYRNDMNGGLAEGFALNEYGIFASDPDIGEVLLYYGTLGQYPQYVAPFSVGAIDVRRFPVSIVLTDEVDVKISYIPLAFMTADDISSYLQEIMPEILQPIDDRLSGHIGAGGITQHPLATQLTPGFSERNFTAENKNELENMPENIAKAVTTGRWAQFIASPFDLNILRAIGGE